MASDVKRLHASTNCTYNGTPAAPSAALHDAALLPRSLLYFLRHKLEEERMEANDKDTPTHLSGIRTEAILSS